MPEKIGDHFEGENQDDINIKNEVKEKDDGVKEELDLNLEKLQAEERTLLDRFRGTKQKIIVKGLIFFTACTIGAKVARAENTTPQEGQRTEQTREEKITLRKKVFQINNFIVSEVRSAIDEKGKFTPSQEDKNKFSKYNINVFKESTVVETESFKNPDILLDLVRNNPNLQKELIDYVIDINTKGDSIEGCIKLYEYLKLHFSEKAELFKNRLLETIFSRLERSDRLSHFTTLNDLRIIKEFDNSQLEQAKQIVIEKIKEKKNSPSQKQRLERYDINPEMVNLKSKEKRSAELDYFEQAVKKIR